MAFTSIHKIRFDDVDGAVQHLLPPNQGNRNAGHILGSSFIRLEVTQGDQTRAILFSGDLGRPDKPILQDPTPLTDADYVVMESTYGNRTHAREDTEAALAKIVRVRLSSRTTSLTARWCFELSLAISSIWPPEWPIYTVDAGPHMCVKSHC